MSTITPPVPMLESRDVTDFDLMHRDNGMLMTPEEFDHRTKWDEHFQYELINGVLIVSPAAGPYELAPNDFLGFSLHRYAEAHPGIIDLTYQECEIRLANSRRRADRGIWIGLGRVPDVDLDPPTIAIEFVSRSRRDRIRDYVTKRAEYLAVGIREYWVFDRFKSILTVFRTLDGADFQQVIQANEIYRTDLLPGFELPIQKLLDLANQTYRKTSSED